MLAIDPGNVYSAFGQIDPGSYRPISFLKLHNSELLSKIEEWHRAAKSGHTIIQSAVIENIIGSYGQVGRTTFDTAIMIGRLEQALSYFVPVEKIPRQLIKKHLCPGVRANDRSVRDALIARFALHDHERGKGTKNNPDFFFGFADDVWSAFAVGVTKLDLDRERNG